MKIFTRKIRKWPAKHENRNVFFCANFPLYSDMYSFPLSLTYSNTKQESHYANYFFSVIIHCEIIPSLT